MKKILPLIICISLILSIVPASYAATGVNIALGKKVICSGWYAQATSEAHAPNKINDGDVNSAWANGASGLNYCTIDLGAEYSIGRIVARTRRDMDQTYNRYGWYIIGSHTEDCTDGVILGTKASAGSYLEDYEISFDEAVSYRYIRVQSTRDIVVSELEVYGTQVDKNTLSYKDIDEPRYENPIRLNQYLGIIDHVSSHEFGVNTLVTREEAARIIKRLTNVQGSYEYNGIYNDVEADSEYGGDIQYCCDMGLISAGGDFRPKDYITNVEFVKMIIYLLGYKDHMEKLGGFGTGTMKVGNELKLFSDVSLIGDSRITRSEALIVIYNMLLMPIWKVGQTEGVIGFSDGDKPYIEEKFGLKLIKGIVDANSATAINGESGKKTDKFVSINGISYADSENYLFDCIGESVYAVIDDESFAIKQTWKNTKDNTYYNISASDIDECTLSGITTDTDKTKRYKFEKNYMVLLNGVSYFDYTADTFKPDDGYLELIDNDNNGSIDVVKVWKPEMYVSSSYSFDEDSIYITDRYGNDLTLENLSQLDICISGVRSSYEDIHASSSSVLIKVYSSESGEYVRVNYGSGMSVSGMAESADDEGVVIDGVKYEFSEFYKKYKNQMSEIRLNYSIEYIVDEYNKFTAVVSSDTSKSGETLAYIRNITHDDDNVFIKLYTENDEFLSLNAAEKMSLDGRRYTHDEISVIIDRDKEYYRGKMAYYRVNENNEVTMLDTENKATENKFEVVEGVVDGNCYRYGTAIYSSSYMKMAFNSNGKAFIVPLVDGKVPTDSSYDNYYEVTTMGKCIPTSTLMKDADWRLRFYNADDYTIPELLVMEKSCYSTNGTVEIDIGEPVDYSEVAYIVQKVSNQVNDDGDICVRLSAYAERETSPVNITIDPDIKYMYEKYKIKAEKGSWCDSYSNLVLSKVTNLDELKNYIAPVTDIHCGDIVHIKMGGGVALAVDRLYSAVASRDEIGLIYSGGSDQAYANASIRLIKGTFTDYVNGRIIIRTGLSTRELLDVATVKSVTMIEGNGKARNIKLSELSTYAAKGLRLLAFTKWANTYAVIAYEE